MKKVLFCSPHFPKAREFTSEILPSGTIAIQCDEHDFREKAKEAFAVVPFMFRIDREIMENSEIRLINQYGAGLEGVDIEAATELGIYVANIPSGDTGNALSVAEHAIYLALSILRNQKGMEQSIRENKIGYPLGETLYGKKALIFGFGNIGRELAKRLRPFEVEIYGIKKSGWAEEEARLVDHPGSPSDLHSMVRNCDILFICAPLTAETRGFVNDDLLREVEEGIYIVNVSRGGLIEYRALLNGLESGKVKGAGLDVFWKEPFPPDDPLLSHPQVVATPHVGGVTEISYRNMAVKLAENVKRVLEGKPPLNWVNPF